MTLLRDAGLVVVRAVLGVMGSLELGERDPLDLRVTPGLCSSFHSSLMDSVNPCIDNA